MPQIDYDKLAKEHGGTTVAAPTVDYDALAREVTTTPVTPAAPSTGVGGFFAEATKGINPVNINAAIQSAFWHPIDTAKGVLAAQDVPRQEALSAFQAGDYLRGTRKMFDWLIPVLGPRMDVGVDRLEQGDVAGGLGALTDVGLSATMPKIVGGVAARIPTRAGVAQAADRMAAQQVTDVIAPVVGPKKIELGTQAARVAPQVARQSTARTAGGLLDEAGEKAALANQKLDAAYAAIPASNPIPTQPVIAALHQAINKIRVRGSGGAMVTPITQAERVASLEQAIQEVRALGPAATADQMRRLRIAWDDGARAVFTPVVADNFKALQQAGHGWADARTALNDVMVGRHGNLGPLNADVRLWTTLRDVLEATEEVERVRPRLGRTIFVSGISAGAGSLAGGAPGAALGSMLGPVIERTIAAGSPAVKLALARRMASLADALAAGQPGAVRRAIGQVSTMLPSAERATFTAQALRLMQDAPATAGLPAAAEDQRRPSAGPR